MLLNTPVCDFGWSAPDFDLAAPDGTRHRLADFTGGQAFLVAFICNHCPYVQRIAADFTAETAALAARGIPTVAIMSNDYSNVPSDAPPEMAKFAKQFGFTFPYLVDENQAVGRAYGAVCTPDFFGFDGAGGLQYRGRFRAPDGTPELTGAMMQIAETGAGPQEQVPSMGCSIKWS